MGEFGEKFGAACRALHQNIAAVEIVALAIDIAKLAEPIERAAYRRLRDTERLRQTAHCVRTFAEIYGEHERHLPCRKIGLPWSSPAPIRSSTTGGPTKTL